MTSLTHRTKAAASLARMPWAASVPAVADGSPSGAGACVSSRNSRYRPPVTGRAQIRAPLPVRICWCRCRVSKTAAIRCRRSWPVPGSETSASRSSRRPRRSAAISLPCSAQSKASASAVTVPDSRHAATMGSASACAVYSKVVSRHHGSSTAWARTLARPLSRMWAAARYSWKVWWTKQYKPLSRSTRSPLDPASARKSSAASCPGRRRSAGLNTSQTSSRGRSRSCRCIIAYASSRSSRSFLSPARLAARFLASCRRHSMTWQISAYRSARLPGSAPR